jgi:hypothetical protein
MCSGTKLISHYVNDAACWERILVTILFGKQSRRLGRVGEFMIQSMRLVENPY